MEPINVSVQSALLEAVDELHQQLAACMDSSTVPNFTDDELDRSDLIGRCATSTREAL